LYTSSATASKLSVQDSLETPKLVFLNKNGKERIKECLGVYWGYGIGIVITSTEKGKRKVRNNLPRVWEKDTGEWEYMQQPLLYSLGRVPLLAGASVTECKYPVLLFSSKPHLLQHPWHSQCLMIRIFCDTTTCKQNQFGI
jgi:hypothetical protein